MKNSIAPNIGRGGITRKPEAVANSSFDHLVGAGETLDASAPRFNSADVVLGSS